MGATAALLRRARDGVVTPLAEHMAEIVVRTRDLSILAEDGQGASWDPIKVEGVVPADSTSALEQAGAGGLTTIDPGAGDPEDDAAAATEVLEAAHAGARAAEATGPPVHRWSEPLVAFDAPARDSYALRLVAARALYDSGRAVVESPILPGLRRAAVLEVHPHDLARIGVEAGGTVRVISPRSSITTAVRPSEAVPPGVARMTFTADGTGVSELVDAAQPVTDLRVETLR
jgi:anaerobic selenocysteine-containing dehydrogenase